MGSIESAMAAPEVRAAPPLLPSCSTLRVAEDASSSNHAPCLRGASFWLSDLLPAIPGGRFDGGSHAPCRRQRSTQGSGRRAYLRSVARGASYIRCGQSARVQGPYRPTSKPASAMAAFLTSKRARAPCPDAAAPRTPLAHIPEADAGDGRAPVFRPRPSQSARSRCAVPPLPSLPSLLRSPLLSPAVWWVLRLVCLPSRYRRVAGFCGIARV